MQRNEYFTVPCSYPWFLAVNWNEAGSCVLTRLTAVFISLYSLLLIFFLPFSGSSPSSFRVTPKKNITVSAAGFWHSWALILVHSLYNSTFDHITVLPGLEVAESFFPGAGGKKGRGVDWRIHWLRSVWMRTPCFKLRTLLLPLLELLTCWVRPLSHCPASSCPSR